MVVAPLVAPPAPRDRLPVVALPVALAQQPQPTEALAQPVLAAAVAQHLSWGAVAHALSMVAVVPGGGAWAWVVWAAELAWWWEWP